MQELEQLKEIFYQKKVSDETVSYVKALEKALQMAVARTKRLEEDKKKLLTSFSSFRVTTPFDLISGAHTATFFEDEIKKRVLESKESKSPLSLIIIEVNRFRDYWNTSKFSEGDSLLYEVASNLQGFLGPTSSLSKTDNGQFSVLIPKTKKEAINLALGLQKSLTSLKIPHCGNTETIFTFGVATLGTQESVKAFLIRSKRYLRLSKKENCYMYCGGD